MCMIYHYWELTIFQVNELDTQPESDDDVLLINNQHDEDDIDVANLQILHELEDM